MNETFFVNTEWYKVWAGKWSILLASYWGNYYVNLFRLGQNTFLKRAAFISRDGYIACAAPLVELKRASAYWSEELMADKRFAHVWAELFQIETDRMLRFMNEHSGEEISQQTYEQFWDLMPDYYLCHIRVKYVVDTLPPDIAESFFSIFEKARNYAEPVFIKVEEFMTELLETFNKKTGVDASLLGYLTESEFKNLFETKTLTVSLAELQERKKGTVLLFDETGYKLLIGDEATKAEAQIVKVSVSDFLKGMVGFPGYARGVVRIVTDPATQTIFNEGDILVASMTRVEFVPLMKKAAAFVTDAGGVLSHVAIVAREMKKPCVIGTQVATKVFKDGDIVEVDAEKGIVRKI